MCVLHDFLNRTHQLCEFEEDIDEFDFRLICEESDAHCHTDCTLKPEQSIADWIKTHLVHPFFNETLPKLNNLLEKNPRKLQVFFLAASYKVSPYEQNRNKMQIEMVDEYNRQLKDVISGANLRHLHWVQISEKIPLAPIDNLPLVLDGTHWSRTGCCSLKQYQKSNPKLANQLNPGLQASHRSLLEVLFNYYCKGFVKIHQKNACCK